MAERVCKVAHRYGGRERAVGERFEVDPRHVVLLLSRGLIETQEGDPGFVARELTAGTPAPYATRDMAAQPRLRKRGGGTQ